MHTDAPELHPAHLAAAAARRPRVLMVVESSSGGTGRHVLDLSEGLIARGCDVHLIYSTGRVNQIFLDRLAEIPRVRHAAVAMRTAIHPRDFGVVRFVRRYAKEHGPFDLIHGHSSKGGAIARLAALGTRAAAFYTLHGLIMMDPDLARWKRMFYLAVELGLGLRTARVIAVSPEEQRAAVRMGFGASRVTLVPNGIAPLELISRDDARRELGMRDEHVVVGFVGRLVSQKAPEVLLRAFALAAACAHLRLAIVGNGPLEDSMRDLAGELGVRNKVLWLGERDARGVLAAFDVFALASRKEGLPYVVLEAMTVGLPVVATDSSGVEILVEQGVTGTVVARDDDRAFAAALVELARDPELLARQGRAALKRVEQFSIDAMVERTLASYLSVIDAAPAQSASADELPDAEDVAATA